jgi:hypothetical protein
MPKEFNTTQALMETLLRDVKAMVRVAGPALQEVGLMVKIEAQAKIGVYQGGVGPFPSWAPLADATKADRSAKGYSEDEPLLRDGTLRDSITFDVHPENVLIGVKSGPSADGKTDIGDIAVWQELGTGKMPPRPFLGPALFESRDEISRIISQHLVNELRRKL